MRYLLHLQLYCQQTHCDKLCVQGMSGKLSCFVPVPAPAELPLVKCSFQVHLMSVLTLQPLNCCRNLRVCENGTGRASSDLAGTVSLQSESDCGWVVVC